MSGAESALSEGFADSGGNSDGMFVRIAFFRRKRFAFPRSHAPQHAKRACRGSGFGEVKDGKGPFAACRAKKIESKCCVFVSLVYNRNRII